VKGGLVGEFVFVFHGMPPKEISAYHISVQEWLQTNTQHEHGSASEAEVQAAEQEMGHRFPDGLRHLLLVFEGPEGFLGESYIRFFDTSELINCWRVSDEWAKGFVPFATNGGGEWYGYDSRAVPVVFVLMPMIGVEWQVAMFLSDTWSGFIETVKTGRLFDKPYQRSNYSVGEK
jgi:hypothetical protein